MNTNTVDAKMLGRMFLAGANNLEAKKEWIKVYGALYGEQDLADSIFEAYKEKVK